MSITKLLSTTTLTLGDRNASASLSYQAKKNGAYTAHFLFDFKNTNTSLEELLGVMGQNSWVKTINSSLAGNEFQPLFGFVTNALQSAVSAAAITIANEKISIGKVVEIPCSSVNITCDNRGADGMRWVVQGLTSKADEQAFFLDITRKKKAITAFSFQGNLSLFKLNIKFVALYNATNALSLFLALPASKLKSLLNAAS